MTNPKILILDIENEFITAGVWGLWGVNVGIDQILEGGKVLCAAYKWLGKSAIHFVRTSDEKSLATIHEAICEADAVVTFNGRRHDMPMLNREFIKAGLGPPSSYRHIDLIETLKKHFKFPSNKLQHVLKELGLGEKEEHEGFPLWIKCMAGDEKAWATMKRYNIKDVKLTEKLYDKLKGWITTGINYNLFNPSGFVCPNCGSKHLVRRGYHATQTQLYRRYRCSGCGSWPRERLTALEKEHRANILTTSA